MSYNDANIYTLGDLVDSVSIRHSFNKEKLIFLNTSDVLEGKVLHHNYTDVAGMPGQAKKSIMKNDILFSEIRPKNKRFAFIDFEAKDFVVSTKLMVLRKKSEKVNTRYLYHFLTSEKILDHFQTLAETRSGTFPQITFNEIKGTKIFLPELEEQEKIVSLIDSISNKIDLNNEINKTIEEIAKNLFKEWFINFEFPVGEGKTYKSNGGKFVEQESKLIPEHWRVGTFKDINKNYDSKRIPLSKLEREKREKIYPYYGAASLMDYVDDYIFDGTYLLIGEDGTVVDKMGFPILQYVWGKFWVNNHAHVLQGEFPFTTEYLFLFLQNTVVSSIVTGAVQPKINQKNLNSIKTIIPDSKTLKNFNDLISPLFEKKKSVLQENDNLIQIRDAIIPKLMSGEVRIDIEREINLCLQRVN